jgi:hypothetical protein
LDDLRSRKSQRYATGTPPSVAAVGTAKIADCIGVLHIGHLGGPIAFCRLGFKHLPWNM